MEVKTLNSEAVEALVRYNWPGNVRELINVLERAILLCESKVITPGDLPDEIARGRKAAAACEPGTSLCGMLPERWLEQPWAQVRTQALENAERWYLDALLRQNRGRIDYSARQAGMTTRAFYSKMQRHSLDKSAYKG